MNNFEQKLPENFPCFLHCASVLRTAVRSSAALEKQKFSSVAPHSVQNIFPPSETVPCFSSFSGREGRFRVDFRFPDFPTAQLGHLVARKYTYLEAQTMFSNLPFEEKELYERIKGARKIVLENPDPEVKC